MTTTVYTDGACLGNPGPGGWAWAVPGGAHAAGAEAHTTNQRMEVTAALEAMRAHAGPMIVVSDSQYVVRCFNDRWYVGWERRGWKGTNRQPVANQDLWRPMVELFHAREAELTFRWVKGHSNDAMNDAVDRLAIEAARTQRGRSGALPPAEVAAPDRPDRPPAAAASDPTDAPGPLGVAESGRGGGPAGHRVVVLGHRPPQLGGYGANPVAHEVNRKLGEAIVGLRAIHPDMVVLTGLGLGAEQLGAEAAAAAGVPYTAVLAFPNPDEVWAAASRATYRRLVEGAADVVVLSPTKPSSKQAAGLALARRDAWLVANADAALVVWDGRDRALADLVKALEWRIPDDVWIISPQPG